MSNNRVEIEREKFFFHLIKFDYDCVSSNMIFKRCNIPWLRRKMKQEIEIQRIFFPKTLSGALYSWPSMCSEGESIKRDDTRRRNENERNTYPLKYLFTAKNKYNNKLYFHFIWYFPISIIIFPAKNFPFPI